MRKPTPKTHRKILRRPIVLEPGIIVNTFDIGRRGSRVEHLPPYGEYNPNRVHVARRRRAHKENNAFPRGWTFVSEVGESHIGEGAIATVMKIAKDKWTVFGDIT